MWHVRLVGRDAKRLPAVLITGYHKRDNRLSMETDRCLLSACQARNNTKFCVITEADRSATTVLLPEDYQIGSPAGPEIGWT